MTIFYIWAILVGFTVGSVAKLLHPGPDPEAEGFWATSLVGIIGSVCGQVLAHILCCHDNIFFSITGGVIVCAAWRYYKSIK